MKFKTLSVVVTTFVLVAAAAYAKEMKQVEYGNEFKFETPVKTDRGIASEKEDREPSSVVAKEKKKPVEEPKEETVEPKPWLYKTEANTKY